MRGFIDECKAKCLAGEALSRAEIVSLLGVEIGSADDEYLRTAAREAAAKIAGGRATSGAPSAWTMRPVR